MRQPDRDGDADVALDAARESRQRQRRSGRAGARCRRGRGRLRRWTAARPAASASASARARSRPTAAYFAMSGLMHHGVGAELQRLEHRHGGAHPVDARDVAAGGDHAARAAADDHGLVGELGIVALFDRRIERVAVDMGDRQLVQFRMTDSRGPWQARQRASAPCTGVRQSRQKPAVVTPVIA